MVRGAEGCPEGDHREHPSIHPNASMRARPWGEKDQHIHRAGRWEELREQVGEGGREGPGVEQGQTLRVQAVAGDVFMLRATGSARAEG